MGEPEKTVLILDDELSIRQGLCDYLEDRLWRVFPVESGEQALALLEKESPNVAVVDIRLGGMDGNTFIREARRKKPGLAFLIYTGSPEFVISSELKEQPLIADNVFKKTTTQLAGLELELCRLLRVIRGHEEQNE